MYVHAVVKQFDDTYESILSFITLTIGRWYV